MLLKTVFVLYVFFPPGVFVGNLIASFPGPLYEAGYCILGHEIEKKVGRS